MWDVCPMMGVSMGESDSESTRPGRDSRGRFVAGHGFAAAGGRARAERLSPERRREIARAARRAQLERLQALERVEGAADS